MDKETLSHYGWIVILVLILAVLLALASPFGNFVAGAIKATTAGFFGVNESALGAVGITIPGQDFEDDGGNGEEMPDPKAGCVTFCKYYANPGCHEEVYDHTDACYVEEMNTLTWAEFQLPENGIKYGYDASVVSDTAIGSSTPDASKGDIDGAFWDCRYTIVSLVIPDTVTAIDCGAFCNCYVLETVIIPGSVKIIGNDAFSSCYALKNLELGEGIEKISNFAFWNCDSLKSVTIPTSVTTIYPIFCRCYMLETVILHDNIDYIDASCFDENPSLKSFTIQPKVTDIPSYAFNKNTSMETLVIPVSVTHIGRAFVDQCVSLKTITYEGTIEQWNNIDFYPGWDVGMSATRIQCSDGVICIKHDGGTATCQNKAVCSVCNIEYGSLGEHNLVNGICSICGVNGTPVMTTTIETGHNPYLNAQNYTVVGTWDYSDAKSVNITITYETEGKYSDWVIITKGTDFIPGSKDETRTYLKNNGGLTDTVGYSADIRFAGTGKITKTFNNVNMLTGSVILKSDNSGNDYYGATVVITPNY
jgi:hypothetical protein